MQILKRMLSVMGALVIAFGLAAPAMAEDLDDLVLRGDPGLNGKTYVVSTRDAGEKEVTWQHKAENLYSNTEDSVTYNVSRTLSFTGNLSGQAEVNALLAKMTVTNEIGLGASRTDTTSCTYSIPGHSAYWCRYGSLLCRTTGRMENWSNGTRTSVKDVSARYTYVSFSDKVPA